MALIVIEAGDIEASDGAENGSPPVGYQAYESGDLMIMFLAGDSNDAITVPAAGPHSETRNIVGFGNSGSVSGPEIGAIWWIGTASRIAGTLAWTIADPEQWAGQTIKILAGEFDSGTPVDSVSGIGGDSNNGASNVPTPSWSPAAAGGTIIVGCGMDGGDNLTGVASGWTEIEDSENLNVVVSAITVRTAVTTSGEVSGSIASVNHSIAADSNSTLGLVINPPAAGVNIPIAMHHYQHNLG